MAKKIKIPAANYPVPHSHDECSAAIKKLGELQRERIRIETAMNDALAKVNTEHQALAAPVKAQIEGLTKGVHAFCETYRLPLTKDGKTKTYSFADGDVSWRIRPPSVQLKKVKEIIAWLRGNGDKFSAFLRAKYEIDKEAMLKDTELATTVPGVSIGSTGEDFCIMPFETKLEEVA